MEKNYYERRAYESVDDGSPSWVTSQKWTENKIQAVKGQVRVSPGTNIKIYWGPLEGSSRFFRPLIRNDVIFHASKLEQTKSIELRELTSGQIPTRASAFW